ncbi:MAG: preprotein translocase subunit SecE [Eubacteriaceae bacterium]|jgi:preprotein translocase subunit SecE|nr:preprotein translocase subunit SecE [Eubacteriaceae bacterium]
MAKQDAKAKKPGFFKRIGNYFTSSYDELKKVQWPSRKELFSHTWIVLAICAIFTIITFVFDSLFQFIFDIFTR